ncbi:uncharacterized protein LOC144432178 [Styela clava]
MVLSHDAMDPMIDRTTSERRTSSPIGIPNAKLSTLTRTHQNILETSESQENSPSSYSPSAIPTVSTSLPAMPHNTHISRFLSDGGQFPPLPQKTDSMESIGEILDRLPEGSPAFAAVFSEIVKLTDGEKKSNSAISQDDIPTIKEPEQNEPEHQDQHPNNSPRRIRKEMKNLKFDLESLQHKGNYRRRAVSASSSRKTKKELPSSTHSTPALARRSKNKNAEQQAKVVHLLPKFKFLTETVTVSHEDIVKEQEHEDRLRNGFSSPKSIFGGVGDASPTH